MTDPYTTDAAPDEDVAAAELDPRQVAALTDAVGAEDAGAISALIGEQHPAHAADLLEQLPEDAIRRAVELAPEAFTGDVLVELGVDARRTATHVLGEAEIAQAVGGLDSDDVIDFLEDLPEERREGVLAILSDRDRQAVEEALQFEEETAGRLTQREVVAAPEFWTAGQAIDHMRKAGGDILPETFFEVYVVDPRFCPIGAIPLSDFLRHPRSALLKDMMRELQVTITPEIDQEDAAYLMNKYHLAQAPVVDEAGRLKGMITMDDVVEVIQEENAEDLLALAGVSEGGIGSSALGQFRARAPWLGVNLVTALAASAVIALFENTIDQVVALAILMPIVAALGGNAGGQALAVAVQALASRELAASNAPRMVAREVLAALMNGALFSVVLAVVAGLWFTSVEIGFVIAVAMVVNILCGGLAGILVPLTLKRMGADPAVASSVFVSTITDIVGFCIFLGLATAVLL